jgi:uncharacterized protein YeaO (DUF488 family)
MIQIKRVYDPASSEDGVRYLVDRLWPRGIKKDNLAMTAWLKEVSPSNQLRQWTHQNPDTWDEFQRRYSLELDSNPSAWQPIMEAAQNGTVTLLYSASDTVHNNAVALLNYLMRHIPGESNP